MDGGRVTRGARVSRNVFVFICHGGCIRDAGKRRLPVDKRRRESSSPSKLGKGEGKLQKCLG